jgi:hypothetical protein
LTHCPSSGSLYGPCASADTRSQRLKNPGETPVSRAELRGPHRRRMGGLTATRGRAAAVPLNVQPCSSPKPMLAVSTKLFNEHGTLVWHPQIPAGVHASVRELRRDGLTFGPVHLMACGKRGHPAKGGCECRSGETTAGKAQNCIGRISSNSSWHASLKPRNKSIVPLMAISRSSMKLLSGSK